MSVSIFILFDLPKGSNIVIVSFLWFWIRGLFGTCIFMCSGVPSCGYWNYNEQLTNPSHDYICFGQIRAE